jgi:glycosyltransferase involved in cell wall biosynthesis
MSFVIFGDTFSFPDGTAATNRVHTYAKGFLENDISVHVICFASEYDTFGDGIIDGIHFYHPFGQGKRSKYFVVRRFQKLLKYFKTLRLIGEINKENRIEAINIWTNLFLTYLFVWLLVRIYRTRLIVECSEHPLRHYQGGNLKRKIGTYKFIIESNLCDGVFCISRYLIEFYKSHGMNQRKLLLLPSTVDAERFNHHFEAPLSFKYILYCGSITVLKDGLDILIESFSKISEKFHNVNLVLIGQFYSEKDEKIIKGLITKLNLNERVILLGLLPRTDIPAYLDNAEILTLARPKSMVADAGFPSKVTEYLATGRPVVVTKVGEIPEYLLDNKNAFLSEPDSVDGFAEKMDFVLSNYDFALMVGEKGKLLASSIFNYNFQVKRIIEFIRSLI